MTTGRTLPLGDLRASAVPPATKRFAPSVKRSKEDRERRHRERAIAMWLRDLSR